MNPKHEFLNAFNKALVYGEQTPKERDEKQARWLIALVSERRNLQYIESSDRLDPYLANVTWDDASILYLPCECGFNHFTIDIRGRGLYCPIILSIKLNRLRFSDYEIKLDPLEVIQQCSFG